MSPPRTRSSRSDFGLGVGSPARPESRLTIFLVPAAIAVITAILYLFTACRTVEFIDSGELAANCFFLGIPHPTGYPLYVSLGRLAVICLPGTVIWRCTLLSVLTTAAAAALLGQLIRQVNFFRPSLTDAVITVSAAVFAATMPVWWDQGTSNEVYSLALLTNLACVSSSITYVYQHRPKYLVLTFYLLGLCFVAHMSAIFLVPALAYVCLTTDGIQGIFRRRYLWAALFFFAALSFYFYLPLRSPHDNFLNWSNPSSWQGFVNHITGWQYRVWMFQSFSKMLDGIAYFGRLGYQQFGTIALALVVLGMWRLARSASKFAIVLACVAVADVLYSANYQIADIDAYYLLAFACLAVFLASGLAFVIRWVVKSLGQRWRSPATIAVSLAMLILVTNQISGNYAKQDKRHKTTAAAGVWNILNSMEPNGLAFVENWDFYSPWLYFHYVEGKRPDAVLIDKDLLRRSWYIDFVRRRHPDITAGSEQEIERFLRLVRLFEAGRKYDARQLDLAYREMIDSLLSRNYRRRPLYFNFVSDDYFQPKMGMIPVGVLFRLQEKPTYMPYDWRLIDISAWENSKPPPDRRAKAALGYIHRAVISRSIFCRQMDRNQEQQEYAQLAQRMEKIFKMPSR